MVRTRRSNAPASKSTAAESVEQPPPEEEPPPPPPPVTRTRRAKAPPPTPPVASTSISTAVEIDQSPPGEEAPQSPPPSVASTSRSRGENVEDDEERREEDTFKILVATDNHLGYFDSNPARENDSFTTFEEILSIAKTNGVDFLLLGGNLFNDNKPKPATLQRVIDLLRVEVLGDKPVEFEYLGDPTKDFPNTSSTPQINFENPNLNIGLPIFTIHGNHDDPIGSHRTSALDHLAAAGLVNHFGQWSDFNKLDISPVCLRKGKTQLALFGLGHMKDERLFGLMRDNKVTFLRPKEDEDSNWCNLFILHQNRTKRGTKNYFPSEFLPEFINVVVWGHEHQCLQEPSLKYNDEGKTTTILQPGSSIVTSLTQEETNAKHVVLLEIHKQDFKTSFIPLQTVRPYLWDQLKISDLLAEYKNVGSRGRAKLTDSAKYIENFIESHIRNMIDEASSKQHSGHPQQPKEPLIKLSVEYEAETEKFNPMKLTLMFAEQVANDDIISFKKKPGSGGGEMDDATFMSIGSIRETIANLGDGNNVHDLGAHVEEIVEKHFTNEKEKDNGQVLDILSEKGLSEAVRCSVEKDDLESIGLIIDAQISATVEHLLRRTNITLDTIEDQITEFRNARNVAGVDLEQARTVLAGRTNNRTTNLDDSGNDEVDDEMEIDNGNDAEPHSSKGARGRGRGRGRGAKRGSPAGARGRGRSRGRAGASRTNATIVESDDEVEEVSEEDEPAQSSRNSRGSRPTTMNESASSSQIIGGGGDGRRTSGRARTSKRIIESESENDDEQDRMEVDVDSDESEDELPTTSNTSRGSSRGRGARGRGARGKGRGKTVIQKTSPQSSQDVEEPPARVTRTRPKIAVLEFDSDSD